MGGRYNQGYLPKKYNSSRKYRGKCERCGKKSKEGYSFVDGNNVAITYYAPYLCLDCYNEELKKHN